MSGSTAVKIRGRLATVYRSGRGYVRVSVGGRDFTALWRDDWPSCRDMDALLPPATFERYMDQLEAEAIAEARRATR